MEQGRTEIINMALLYAGQDTINDPRGESKNAKLCAQVYEDTLAEVLSGHPWSFAMVAARLQQLSETPKDFRFNKVYQLPDNCGRILSVEGMQTQRWWDNGQANTMPTAEYSVQGDKLLSSNVDLQILYIRKNVHPYEMTPQFRNYFAAMMAWKLFYKITGSREGEDAMSKKAQLLQMEARHTDGEQTDTMPVNRPNLFVNVRVY